MFKHDGRKRSGFTLPEVLVTVAIISVLAAIVVPTVTSQIGKGDDTRMQTSISNVRTGITAFVSDVRRFPAANSHLFNDITGLNDLSGVAYAGASNRWKGPYVSGSLPVGDSLQLGLAYMRDALVDSNFAGGTGYVIATLTFGSPTTFTTAQALRLDSLIDAANGQGAGILRWPAGAGPHPETRLKLQIMGSR